MVHNFCRFVEPLGHSVARWSTERHGGQIRIGLTRKWAQEYNLPA